MKRSFPVNINGRIYNIDEDAYQLLDNYLTQLRATFASDDEREIVDDIEARINEHFAENTDRESIITLDDVTGIIEIMGRPEQLRDSEESTADETTSSTTPPPYNPGGCPPLPLVAHKKYYRRLDDKVFGGVISGAATYMNWNVTLLRLLVVVLALSTWVGPCMVAYLVLWMIIPPANTPRRRLELEGEPVTPDAIGRTVTRQACTNPQLDTPDRQSGLDTLSSIFNIIIKAAVGFFGLIAGAVGIATFFSSLVLLLIGLGCSITSPVWMDATFNLGVNDGYLLNCASPTLPLYTAGLVLLAIALPALALTWGGCMAIFRAPAPSKVTVITLIVIEVLLILGAIMLAGYIKAHAICATMAAISSTPLIVACA